MPRLGVPRVTPQPEPDLHEISMRPIVVPARPASTLDPIVHERVRLAMLCSLAANPALSFSELKRILDLTDGNLSVHARRLEAVGYVTSTKLVEGRTPRTEFRLTPAGRRALARYLDHMEAIIRAARGR